MMALNVTYHDDRRLCANECHDNAVTVRHGPGLNNPIAELPELHSNPNCSSANEPGDGDPSQHSAVDFRRTNCYQLPSPSDTSFAPCLLRG